MGMTMRRRQQQGYSLLELSVVLLIIGLVVGAGVALMVRSIEVNQQALTEQRMETIQRALLDYRRAFGRLPCPGNPTLPLVNQDFGVEANNPGRCRGGTILPQFISTATVSANLTNASATATVASTTPFSTGMFMENSNITGGVGAAIRSIDSATQFTLAATATATTTQNLTYVTIVAGAVPVKTLGLSDDFVADGWGRRFNYVVSVPFTAQGAFSAIDISDVRQRIRIVSTGTTDKVTHAAYALVSYGKNGHGGFARNGGATRLNSKSVNADEQINCDCNDVAVASNSVMFSRLVQKLPTENPANTRDLFDDIVVFATRQDLRTSLE
jgi:prepilin-type N-terminal cleavage/methylation domain-containing protein